MSRPRDVIRVPKAMSTQHPDNAFPPPFAQDTEAIRGEDEILEAEYVYSVLGCDEQMWDYEGKDTDVDVVMKLLTANPDFFRANPFGSEVFLTMRIPNPTVEQGTRKKVEEALHNVPTSYDLAQQFYGEMKSPPIFEVILPMTTSAEDVLWVFSYYKKLVAGMGDLELVPGKRLRQWLGDTLPEEVNVIPLVENLDGLTRLDSLVDSYLNYLSELGSEPSHMRVFLARSDPALNYGLVSATLMNKIALQRLGALEQSRGVAIYPIIGVGAVPFRGNLRPGFVDDVIQEYPSVHTFTVQSSFKYDHPQETVQREVHKLRDRQRSAPLPVDEERALDVIHRYTSRYQQQVEKLAPIANALATAVPRRRARRLHIGLYGYSRDMDGAGGNVVRLPRAITFCAALYSLGLPPELIALESLTDDDRAFLSDVYPHFTDDVAAAATYADEEAVEHYLGRDALEAVKPYIREVNTEHLGLTRLVSSRLKEGHDLRRTKELVIWAAETRRFLG